LWQQGLWVNLPAKRESPVQIHGRSFKKSASGLRHNQALHRTPKASRLLCNSLRSFYCTKAAPLRAPLNLALAATALYDI